MYIKSGIALQQLSDLSVSNDHIETLFVDCCLERKPAIIGVIYRRPNANLNAFLETFDNLLSNITSSGKLIILGEISILTC